MNYFWIIISLETPVFMFSLLYLTSFLCNNWQSIIDVVERLCSWVKSEVIVLHIFCNFFLSLKSRAKSQMFQTAGTAINASWMSIVAKAGVYVQALYYGLRKTTWIWHLNCKGRYISQIGKGNTVESRFKKGFGSDQNLS